MSSTKTVGVVIGRFQTPKLHKGHMYLIQTAEKENDRLCIIVGCSDAQPTKRNPMNFETRKAMFEDTFDDVDVKPLYDVYDDHHWSLMLDAIIEEAYPDENVTLYASRDSFAEVYSGTYPVKMVPQDTYYSATEVRENVLYNPKHNEDFRCGVVYGVAKRFPVKYQTVGVAVLNDDKILLGKKKAHGGPWSFIGGFVDPADASLEDAALRELKEEVGDIRVTDPVYIGSTHINDMRYRKDDDDVMSAMFTVTYIDGEPKADDDLDEVQWFNLSEVEGVLVEEQKPLFDILKKVLYKK